MLGCSIWCLILLFSLSSAIFCASGCAVLCSRVIMVAIANAFPNTARLPYCLNIPSHSFQLKLVRQGFTRKRDSNWSVFQWTLLLVLCLCLKHLKIKAMSQSHSPIQFILLFRPSCLVQQTEIHFWISSRPIFFLFTPGMYFDGPVALFGLFVACPFLLLSFPIQFFVKGKKTSSVENGEKKCNNTWDKIQHNTLIHFNYWLSSKGKP